MSNDLIVLLIYSLFLGPKGLANICLTCFSVPEGLGVKIATKERSDDCNFHAKGNVKLKQLLAFLHISNVLKTFLCAFLLYQSCSTNSIFLIVISSIDLFLSSYILPANILLSFNGLTKCVKVI